MKKIVFATGNQGKLREVKKILADLNVDIVSMKEEGIQIDVDENGTTFAENAQIKATAIGAHTDAIVLADDSGLVIDALNGEPGIYSARYLGEDTSYRIKNQNLIDRLEGVPDEKRTAHFVLHTSFRVILFFAPFSSFTKSETFTVFSFVIFLTNFFFVDAGVSEICFNASPIPKRPIMIGTKLNPSINSNLPKV